MFRKIRIFILITIAIICYTTVCLGEEPETVHGNDWENETDFSQEDELITYEEKLLLEESLGEKIDSIIELQDYQQYALDLLRSVRKDLSKRYPKEEFISVSFDLGTIFSGVTTYTFTTEEAKRYGEFFIACTEDEDEKQKWADDFYGFLIRKDYDAKLLRTLKENGITALTYTHFSKLCSYSEKILPTPEDILEEGFSFAKLTSVFIPDTPENKEEIIKDILQKNGFYGSYYIYFVPGMNRFTLDELEKNRRDYWHVFFTCEKEGG